MKQIVTLTFSPAIDKSTSVPQLIAEKKMNCTAPYFEPGGGGINVARAIHRLGGKVLAVYFSGGHSGKYFRELLERETVPQLCVDTVSHTRENLVVLETSTNKQYRFGMPAPKLTLSEITQCMTALDRIEDMDYLVVSGSIPLGLPADLFPKLAAVALKKNAKLIVDTSGVALRQALDAGAYLIKPNLRELSSLVGTELKTQEQIIQGARKLIADSSCKNILVSMANKGAMLVTAETTLKLASPAVTIKSTVGAGDSMLAGMVLALSKGSGPSDALSYAIACGTAATLSSGTGLCHPNQVAQLLAELDQCHSL
jgi:6-phosphofructokinase 2